MPSERERALRALLLGELKRIGGHTLSEQEALSYKEKKHLVEETDPAFIDEELKKMRASLRTYWWSAVSPVLIFLAFLGQSLIFGSGWIDFASGVGFGFALVFLPLWASIIYYHQQTKQRIFLYRALRALATGSAEPTPPPYADTLERAAAEHAPA